MKIGIIVGRFQVPVLHHGHNELIMSAEKECDKVFIFLGCTKDGKLSKHDPLPFEARKISVLESHPELHGHIFKINDLGDWPRWVKSLDGKIDSLKDLGVIDDTSEIVLYGSRDSVVLKYKENGGVHETRFIEATGNVSGTMIRNNLNFTPSWDKKEREFLAWLILKNDIL